MSKKVVIFQELLSRFPRLAPALAQWGAEAVPVAGGREVMQQIGAASPAAILLDVAMPQMSGIECCRQIKEGRLAQNTGVVLVSSVQSEGIEERAVNAGCDLYVFQADAETKILEYLRPLFEEDTQSSIAAGQGFTPAHNLRAYSRVSAEGPVMYEVDGVTGQGNLINLSRSGILFALDRTIPNGKTIAVAILGRNGKPFRVSMNAVRSVLLQEPHHGYSRALGGRFVDVSPEISSKLEALMAFIEPQPPLLTADFVRAVLTAEPSFLSPAIVEGNEETVSFFLKSLSPTEAAAFSAEDARSKCIQRLVLMRVQCGVFYAFVPYIKADARTLGEAFLGFLPELISRVEAIEAETDGHVRATVSAGEEAARKALNETSNRLHSAKMQLLTRVAETLSADTLGSHAEKIEELLARASQVSSSAEEIAPQPLKYERKSKTRGSRKRAKNKKFQSANPALAWGIFGGIVLLTLVIYFLSVSPDNLSAKQVQIRIPVEKVVLDEGKNLVIVVKEAAWLPLNRQDQDDILIPVEEYMRKEKLSQMKLVDEKGRPLAAIVSAPAGTVRLYSRRFFR